MVWLRGPSAYPPCVACLGVSGSRDETEGTTNGKSSAKDKPRNGRSPGRKTRDYLSVPGTRSSSQSRERSSSPDGDDLDGRRVGNGEGRAYKRKRSGQDSDDADDAEEGSERHGDSSDSSEGREEFKRSGRQSGGQHKGGDGDEEGSQSPSPSRDRGQEGEEPSSGGGERAEPNGRSEGDEQDAEDQAGESSCLVARQGCSGFHGGRGVGGGKEGCRRQGDGAPRNAAGASQDCGREYIMPCEPRERFPR